MPDKKDFSFKEYQAELTRHRGMINAYDIVLEQNPAAEGTLSSVITLAMDVTGVRREELAKALHIRKGRVDRMRVGTFVPKVSGAQARIVRRIWPLMARKIAKHAEMLAISYPMPK